MPADMVDRDQRHAQRERGSLGEVHAHQHRADEAGSIAHRHGVDVLPSDPRSLERALGQQRDGLDMAARRDLRHDAAVHRVQIGLGKDLIAQDLSAVLDDGHGGLVAGGFKGKYFHVSSRPFPRKISS